MSRIPGVRRPVHCPCQLPGVGRYLLRRQESAPSRCDVCVTHTNEPPGFPGRFRSYDDENIRQITLHSISKIIAEAK